MRYFIIIQPINYAMDKTQILSKIELKPIILKHIAMISENDRKALSGTVLTCEVYFLFFHTADYLL